MGFMVAMSTHADIWLIRRDGVKSRQNVTVASEKDDQMSETMINCRNLPNPLLFEPFSVLAMTPPITLLLPYI